MSKHRGHVVAIRGSLQMLYEGRGDPKPNDMAEMCRIYDPQQDTLSDPLPIQVALKWGYWTEPPKKGKKGES